MISAWAHDGSRLADYGHLRSISLGNNVIFIDTREGMPENVILSSFQVKGFGDFAIKTDSDVASVFNFLRNITLNHHLIFGPGISSINDPYFGNFFPSYDSIFCHLQWEDLYGDELLCAKIIYDARLTAFRALYGAEKFFKLFPSTGCPYIHCWDEDKDDIESTCTLCEGVLYCEDIFAPPICDCSA